MKLLEEADHIVSGDRAGDYGENSLPAIARLWSEHVGAEITARDVAWMMVLLKSVRDRHKEKRDNLVDAIGYIQLAEVNTQPEPEGVPGVYLSDFKPGDKVRVTGGVPGQEPFVTTVDSVGHSYVTVANPGYDGGGYTLHIPRELERLPE